MTNPDKAVALNYQALDQLPRVAATGTGDIAQRIIRLAEENNIPIEKNPELADLLAVLRPGVRIPERTHELVAAVLCFLYEADAEFRKGHPFLGGVS